MGEEERFSKVGRACGSCLSVVVGARSEDTRRVTALGSLDARMEADTSESVVWLGMFTSTVVLEKRLVVRRESC